MQHATSKGGPMSHKMITEADIEALPIAQSFERGYDYFHSETVYQVVQRGNELTSEEVQWISG
jgi:hypothetical protein